MDICHLAVRTRSINFLGTRDLYARDALCILRNEIWRPPALRAF
jgi:hypothetical protein